MSSDATRDAHVCLGPAALLEFDTSKTTHRKSARGCDKMR